MPIPGNIPGNPGIEKFIPVFPGTAFPGNTRGPKCNYCCRPTVIGNAAVSIAAVRHDMLLCY